MNPLRLSERRALLDAAWVILFRAMAMCDAGVPFEKVEAFLTATFVPIMALLDRQSAQGRKAA